MSRIIVAIIIVVLILTGGILEQVYVYNTFNDLAEYTLEIADTILAGDKEKSVELTDALVEFWHKKRDVLELTSPHNEVKDMMAYISQLKGFLLSDQLDCAYAQTFVVYEDALNKLNILGYKVKNVF